MKKKALKKLAIFTAAMTMVLSSMTVFAEGTYTTKAGDNLSKIAKEIYGDALKWREIYESNKSQIKDPNVIYSNQTLVIPDLNGETTAILTPETPAGNEMPVTEDSIPAETEAPATETETPENTETVSAPVENVPVGTNPVWTDYTGGGFRYTFIDGDWIHCPDSGYITTVDAYGVRYRDAYGDGAGAIVASKVAEYMTQNPDSNFTSFITQYGNQFVIVITSGGLWDDTYDYYWTYGIIDCEPDDCVYMFIAGNCFYEDYVEEPCNDLFDAISNNIIF